MSLEANLSRGEIDRWTDALDWYLILRDADREALTQAVGRRWHQWYANSENRHVFEHLSLLLAARRQYRVRNSCRSLDSADDTYDPSMTVAEWRRKQELPPARPRSLFFGSPGRIAGTIVAAGLAALLIARSVRHESGSGSVRATVYETGPGHRREVNLADGSHVILGRNTALSIALSSSRRAVTLIKGRAWFSVAPAPGRPFYVSAGSETIRDVGTAFLVARELDRVIVAVTMGQVEVAAPQPIWRRLGGMLGLTADPALTKVLVTRGERVAFDSGPVFNDVTWTAAAASGGRATCSCPPLIFHDETLRDIVASVQRYSSKQLVLDPTAAAIRLSGLVFRDKIGEWLNSLSEILPLTVEQRGSYVLIRMRHVAMHRSKAPRSAAE